MKIKKSTLFKILAAILSLNPSNVFGKIRPLEFTSTNSNLLQGQIEHSDTVTVEITEDSLITSIDQFIDYLEMLEVPYIVETLDNNRLFIQVPAKNKAILAGQIDIFGPK